MAIAQVAKIELVILLVIVRDNRLGAGIEDVRGLAYGPGIGIIYAAEIQVGDGRLGVSQFPECHLVMHGGLIGVEHGAIVAEDRVVAVRSERCTDEGSEILVPN